MKPRKEYRCTPYVVALVVEEVLRCPMRKIPLALQRVSARQFFKGDELASIPWFSIRSLRAYAAGDACLLS